MSDHQQHRSSGPKSFYGNLAAGYDRMVDFDRRVDAATQFVQRLNERFPPASAEIAVDLGCGTGAYTLALAQCDFITTGVDISQDMLEKAREHAAERKAEVDFIDAPLQNLPDSLPWGRTDLVLCLGNTLPHITDPEELQQVFAELKRLLRPSGICVIQTLNYDRILRQKERVISVDRQDDLEFVRFYDFLEDNLLRFNILKITWKDNKAHPTPLDSVLLRAYTCDDLRQLADRADLDVDYAAGGLTLGPFDPHQSDTALLVLKS